YVSNRDGDLATFPYLINYRFPIKQFDGRYTFVFPARSALYVVRADTGQANFLRENLGPPLWWVGTPSGAPVYSLYRVPADWAGQYNKAVNLQQWQADFGGALEVSGYAANQLKAGAASPVAVEWRVKNSQAETP